MTKLLAVLLMFGTLATPLLAAKKSTVTIMENVTVGPSQITAGDYKLTYEGQGPVVKVTLSKDGGSPIVLDATLVPSKNHEASVTYSSATDNGIHQLQEIDLSNATLIFETSRDTIR